MNPGPKPYLNTAEESKLADFLKTSAKAAYGKTCKQVLSVVQHVAKEKGVLIASKISRG